MKADVSNPGMCPVQSIAVKLIDPSPANKRKDFDVKELAENIESQGLLQPIIVRKSPKKKDRFEIVVGERRWRAFQLKGWQKIPAVVRELNDADAHEITASENLQREDLTPIEESESIKVLINDGKDAKEIADRIGKPVSWVVRRARIADLSPKWIKAISDVTHPLSKWSATHLELIARYEHKKQDELFENYGNKWENNALLTVRDLEKELNADMLVLSSAPWKPSDETLLPAAGACTQCQERTSCAPSLFEPVEDTKVGKSDRCLNRECWGKKLVAYHELGIKKAREENKSLILISKAERSRGILPDNHPWKESQVETYKYDKAKKSDAGAVPAYIIDGPGAGSVQYMKKLSWYSGSQKSRPIGDDGKPAPKNLKERRAGLEKRRVIRFITKHIMILGGENPELTGTKGKNSEAGVCRICGCTETTPCIDDNGDSCSWVKPNLCSACVEKTENSGVDPRNNIVENLSHIEVHALVAAFGAAPSDIADDHEFDRWNIYKKVAQMNGADAMRTAAYGAFDRIIDNLRQLTYVQKPQVEFADKLCEALKLDRAAIWNEVISEIPEPKSWANLKADGTLKKKSKKPVTDMVEAITSEDVPATHYNYQGHDIFVSSGLGGKTFGTFRKSNGGIKRIVSKKLPMIADFNEAQRNLDKFAKDNRLNAGI